MSTGSAEHTRQLHFIEKIIYIYKYKYNIQINYKHAPSSFITSFDLTHIFICFQDSDLKCQLGRLKQKKGEVVSSISRLKQAIQDLHTQENELIREVSRSGDLMVTFGFPIMTFKMLLYFGRSNFVLVMHLSLLLAR